MARYLVIEFRENSAALKMMEKILTSSRRGASFRVVGLFVKPGKTCECPDWPRINYGDKNEQHGVERGEKFGWWICTRCNKPRKAGHQLRNQLLASDCFSEVNPQGEYEFNVTNLSVTGIRRENIDRPEELKQVNI